MYWILKTEPSGYHPSAFADLERDQQTRWDGIRNYQARNNLKAMKKGDFCLITLKNKTEVEVSRRKKTEIIDKIKNISG